LIKQFTILNTVVWAQPCAYNMHVDDSMGVWSGWGNNEFKEWNHSICFSFL